MRPDRRVPRPPDTFPISPGSGFRKQIGTNNSRQTRCRCNSQRARRPHSGLAWPAGIWLRSTGARPNPDDSLQSDAARVGHIDRRGPTPIGQVGKVSPEPGRQGLVAGAAASRPVGVQLAGRSHLNCSFPASGKGIRRLRKPSSSRSLAVEVVASRPAASQGRRPARRCPRAGPARRFERSLQASSGIRSSRKTDLSQDSERSIMGPPCPSHSMLSTPA